MMAASPETLTLRDIHLPPAPDWWPPAWGWWLLGLVLLLLLAGLGLRLWHRFRIRQRRRRLLGLLAELERQPGPVAAPEFLARVSRLLRQVALSRYPRREVAPLNGTEWLRFLDRSGGAGGFESGPGRVLADGPYRREVEQPGDRHALLALARTWIERNTDGRDDA